MAQQLDRVEGSMIRVCMAERAANKPQPSRPDDGTYETHGTWGARHIRSHVSS